MDKQETDKELGRGRDKEEEEDSGEWRRREYVLALQLHQRNGSNEEFGWCVMPNNHICYERFVEIVTTLLHPSLEEDVEISIDHILLKDRVLRPSEIESIPLEEFIGCRSDTVFDIVYSMKKKDPSRKISL